MTVEAARPTALPAVSWQRELTAGLIAGLLALPVCLAAGVLVFAPLGQRFFAEGAAAGLYGAIIAGAVAALAATSSFVITCPRAGSSLVLATLIAALAVNPTFAGNPALIVTAAALCVFLAGLWQIVFGLFHVARIIKFTPHPVFAGFVNGAALLIAKAQIKPYFVNGDGAHVVPQHPLMLAFVVALALLAAYHLRLTRQFKLPPWVAKVPGAISAFVVGMIAYYLIKWIGPTLDLGPSIGRPDIVLTSPLLLLWDADNAARIWSVGGNVALISLVLAIVASLDSLMSLRAAQTMADLHVHPVRELAAQGLGNCAAALLAPIASSAIPTLQTAAYRAGGRTRLTGLVAAATILIVGVGLSDAVAAVPNGVLSAILLGTGIAMVDTWSLRLFTGFLRNASPLTRRRDLSDLLVVVAVMGITAMTTIVIGVIAGSMLAALIFVINMSRPVVRRSYLGHEIFSRRTRSTDDIAILQKTGQRRAVLQLEGVLFFGNAEDLSQQVRKRFEHADMIVLDMRTVTDIDVSGATILGNLVTRSRTQGKQLLFCNVPADLTATVRNLFDRPGAAEAAIKPDLETALEWIEEESLRASLDERSRLALMPLEQIDFLQGVSEQELDQLRPVLKLREFAAGEAICREGDPGDRMWLLVKGSVSVRLKVTDSRGSRRITSLGRGTMFGEMALIEGAPRSASIVADEAVACYELSSDDFDVLLRDKPDIAARIMRNTARELARRLRRTSEDLRHAAS